MYNIFEGHFDPLRLSKIGMAHPVWSKWPISDLVFYNIRMPPCSCSLGSSLQLTGALKWGTAQTSTSTDTGIMRGQSWNFEIYLVENKCSTSTFHKSCTN